MKPKTKKLFKILILIIALFIVFSNDSVSFASESGGIDTAFDNGILDGLLGVLFYFVRLVPALVGGLLQLIATSIAGVGGLELGDGILTMEHILFNEIPMLNLANLLNPQNSIDIVQKIMNSVSTWYYALRNVAIILSLCILIYVGIRMALSTIAEDKAKYKKMLTDWIVGFITIFLIHYIIVITINLNSSFVSMLKPTEGNSNFANYTEQFFAQAMNAFSEGFINGLVSAIIYVLLVGMIFMFLFSYIKRVLTVAFLMVIAPIITVTYSIDKMGDRKISGIKYMVKRIHI